MLAGLAIVFLWTFAVLFWLMARALWFIGMPSLGLTIELVKGLWEEKKRVAQHVESETLQRLEELNSTVASAVSNQNTSS